MTLTIKGQLEIDHDRGVVYFHDGFTGATLLRICNLPTPIPQGRSLDITHLHNTDWDGQVRFLPEPPPTPAEQLDPNEKSLLNFNKKVQAIKAYRLRTGLGLREAADAVKKLAREAGLWGGPAMMSEGLDKERAWLLASGLRRMKDGLVEELRHSHGEDDESVRLLGECDKLLADLDPLWAVKESPS